MISPDEPLRWEWSLPSRAACLGAGLAAERHALHLGWQQTEAAYLSLVVVELATNAVRHGARASCTLELDELHARIEVRDEGPGFPRWVLARHAANRPIEGADPEQGPRRGLGAGLDVVRRLAAEVILANDGPRGGARALVRIVRARVPPGTPT